MSDVIMPKMSDSMEEGKILKWLKQVGEPVEKGEPIVEIETDKANVEVEAPDSGVVGTISVGEGETVPIGTVIAVISGAAETAGSKDVTVVEAEVPAQPNHQDVPPPETPIQPVDKSPQTSSREMEPSSFESDVIKVSPLARRIAQDAGLDVTMIHGTGPGGRIVESDVREFIDGMGGPAPVEQKPEVKPPTPPKPTPFMETIPPVIPAAKVEIGNIWRTVGKRMQESKQQAPHFYVSMEIDMDEAMQIRRMMNEGRPEDKPITVNDIIVRACALALAKHPMLNASYTQDGTIEMHKSINIGIAVAIPEGLIAPTVHDCQRKSLTAISDESRELIRKTRNGEIRPEEYSGATFTVSNLGMYGVNEFTAIIVPPQAAILAVGAAMPVPVVVDGAIEIRTRMIVTVSADHRVTDGARVAEFLKDLKHYLENTVMLVE